MILSIFGYLKTLYHNVRCNCLSFSWTKFQEVWVYITNSVQGRGGTYHRVGRISRDGPDILE